MCTKVVSLVLDDVRQGSMKARQPEALRSVRARRRVAELSADNHTENLDCASPGQELPRSRSCGATVIRHGSIRRLQYTGPARLGLWQELRPASCTAPLLFRCALETRGIRFWSAGSAPRVICWASCRRPPSLCRLSLGPFRMAIRRAQSAHSLPCLPRQHVGKIARSEP